MQDGFGDGDGFRGFIAVLVSGGYRFLMLMVSINSRFCSCPKKRPRIPTFYARVATLHAVFGSVVLLPHRPQVSPLDCGDAVATRQFNGSWIFHPYPLDFRRELPVKPVDNLRHDRRVPIEAFIGIEYAEC